MSSHQKSKNVRFRDAGGLAVVFLIGDIFLSLLLYFSIGSGAVSAFMFLLGVIEVTALAAYFAKAVFDALPKSVQRTLTQN